MSQEVEAEDFNANDYVRSVVEHIRLCHQRIGTLHDGALALRENARRDLQIAQERVQQAETRAEEAERRRQEIEAKYLALVELIKNQLLPIVEAGALFREAESNPSQALAGNPDERISHAMDNLRSFLDHPARKDAPERTENHASSGSQWGEVASRQAP